MTTMPRPLLLRRLLLLCTIAAALGCVPPKTLRRSSSTRLGLELDPVLASALATCVVRAPSTATLVRSLAASRGGSLGVSRWGLRRILARWASVDELSFPKLARWASVDELSFSKLVADSVSTQGVEWLLDTLSWWTRHCSH